MYAEHAPIYDLRVSESVHILIRNGQMTHCCEIQMIEHLAAGFPNGRVPIFILAFI